MFRLTLLNALVTMLCLAGKVAAEPPAAASQPATPKPAYESQQWPKTRVLTWGKGNVDIRKLDLADPGNWLEDGKPATAWPDTSTDLVVPAGARAGWRGSNIECRHLTVEKGASFSVAKVRLTIHGNFHIQEGANVYFQPLVFAGPAHTFARNDNKPDPSPRPGGTDKRVVAPWILVQKTRGGSVEFQGDFASNDEFKFNEGLAIVGPGARLTAGPASIQIIGPEAILEIQSGATFEKRVNASHDNPDVLVQGMLRAGSPERPLTSDARLGISIKLNEKQEKGFTPSKGSSYASGPNQYSSSYIGGGQDSYGLLVEPKGKLKVHTSDAAKARLIIQYHGRGGRAGIELAGSKITAALLGEVDLNGVLLDDFKKGGITGLADWSRWPKVAFGSRNEGAPRELLRQQSASETPTPASP